MRILALFGTHYALQRHIDDLMYIPSAEWNARDYKLILGDTHIYYRVVLNIEDVLHIAGYEVHLVEWHYTPDEDVRRWVMSRVRGVV